MSFKYTNWKPFTGNVPASSKPVDHCAPKPNSERFVMIEDRNMDMIHDYKDTILEKLKYNKEVNGYDDSKITSEFLPRPTKVRLGDVMFVTDIQRDAKNNHIIDNIMTEYNAYYFSMPLAGYDPIRKRYAVDEGQQRLLSLRDRIRLGLQPDCAPEDWQDYPVWLQVITLEVNNGIVDYGPCRMRFIIENDRKLPVSEFEKFKNEVQGKLTDSPNSPTAEHYEKAAKAYNIVLNHGIIPIDSKDKKQASKAGALGAVRYLRNDKLTFQEIEIMSKHFYDYARQEPFYDVMVEPIVWIIQEMKDSPNYNSNDSNSVAELEKCLRHMNAYVADIHDGDWEDLDYHSKDVWRRRMDITGEDLSRPWNYPVVYILQILKKMGYVCPLVNQNIYNKFMNPSGYDTLTQEEKDVLL